MYQSTMGNCKSKKAESTDTSDKISPNGDNNKIQENDIIKAQNIGSLGSAPLASRYQGSSNEDVIDSTKAEVNYLLERIHGFQGTNENDKNYRYLDEMLTRCILKLDRIECNNSADRSNRKQAIKGVNQAISILERKLEINSDIMKLESNLSEIFE